VGGGDDFALPGRAHDADDGEIDAAARARVRRLVRRRRERRLVLGMVRARAEPDPAVVAPQFADGYL